jgi:O-antigen/teichoic acid export membrane protein
MRARARDARALALGSVLNGLLAYAFFVMATRALGSSDAAPVALLWTYWSFAAAALTFPLQHWITRSVAAHGSQGAVREALPRVAVAILGLSVVTGVISWLARDELFHSDDVAFPLLVVAVTLGSGFMGVVRGGLAAQERFFSLATAFAGENLLRVVAAAALIVLDADDAVGFGICMALGSLVGLAWPRSFRFSADTAETAAVSAGAFLGPAAGGQLISQAVLVGGPVLLAWGGGTASEVTALFAALAVFRAPYTVVLGLLSQLTGVLTRLVTEQHRTALRKVKQAILAGTAAAVALAAALGAVTGSQVLPRIFGSGVRLDAGPSTLAAIGSALALANLVLTVVLMAHGRTAPIAGSWLIAVAAGALAFALVPNGPLYQTCWAFAFAEAAAFGALVVSETRGSAPATRRGVDPDVSAV